MVKLRVNGEDRSYDGDPAMPLLWYLRDELALTGTKFGCGVAACGACTVHLNGEAVRACATAMGDVEGQAVVTIEGLSRDGNHPRAEGVAQHQRAAMRLLPGRADHAGGGAAAADAEPDRRGHRRRHAGQHLPLRHLSAHPRRHQGRRPGSGVT